MAKWHTKTHCIRGHLLDETRTKSPDGYSRCRLCINERQRNFVKRNGGAKYNRNQNLKQKYGITQQEWEKLFNAQSSKCAICETTTGTWHTDHCHTTGKVRGILCSACNINLGSYEAIVKYEDKIKAYLK